MSAEHPLPRFQPEAFRAVEALGLPEPKRNAVTHGLALAAYGLRDVYADIDMTTCVENIQHLRRELGFEVVRNVVGKQANGSDKEVLSTRGALTVDGVSYAFDVWQWDFSRQEYRDTRYGRIKLEAIPTMLHVVTRTPVVTLEHILRVKSLPRPGTHDEEDIRRIHEVLGRTA